MESAQKAATLIETLPGQASSLAINATAAPALTIWDAARKRLELSKNWLGHNALSLACLAIGAAGIAFAATFNSATASSHTNQKWIIFAAVIFAAIGGFWGVPRSAGVKDIGVSCVMAIFASFALHAGLLDTIWHSEYGYGTRLAATVGGLGLLALAAARSLVEDIARSANDPDRGSPFHSHRPSSSIDGSSHGR